MIPAGQFWIGYSSRRQSLSYWPLADWHLFNAACATRILERDLQRIQRDKASFWFGSGDYAELIAPDDKRFDPSSVSDMTVADLGKLGQVQAEQTYRRMVPVCHKCFGVGRGNHEDAFEINNLQQHLSRWLADSLRVNYLDYCSMFDVIHVRHRRFDSPHLSRIPLKGMETYRVRLFQHHGAGSAQIPGGKLNRLVAFMDYFDADITCIAHIHDQLAKRLVRLGCDATCSKVTERITVGVVTGTYLRTYADGVCTYGEKRGYRGVPLGAVRVQVEPENQEVHATI